MYSVKALIFKTIDKRRKSNFGSNWFIIDSKSYEYNVIDDGTAYHDKLRLLYKNKMIAQHELEVSEENLQIKIEKFRQQILDLKSLAEKFSTVKLEIEMLEKKDIPMLRKGM